MLKLQTNIPKAATEPSLGSTAAVPDDFTVSGFSSPELRSQRPEYKIEPGITPIEYAIGVLSASETGYVVTGNWQDSFVGALGVDHGSALSVYQPGQRCKVAVAQNIKVETEHGELNGSTAYKVPGNDDYGILNARHMVTERLRASENSESPTIFAYGLGFLDAHEERVRAEGIKGFLGFKTTEIVREWRHVPVGEVLTDSHPLKSDESAVVLNFVTNPKDDLGRPGNVTQHSFVLPYTSFAEIRDAIRDNPELIYDVIAQRSPRLSEVMADKYIEKYGSERPTPRVLGALSVVKIDTEDDSRAAIVELGLKG